MEKTPNDLRTLWNTALDAGVNMQREALDSARDAARTNVAMQRAALRGMRAGIHRFVSTAVPRDNLDQAADAIARTIPGSPDSQESLRRTTADALRATFSFPFEGTQQMASLVMEPYDRLLDVMEAQVEGTSRAWTGAVLSAAEMNRSMTMAMVEAWSNAFTVPGTPGRPGRATGQGA